MDKRGNKMKYLSKKRFTMRQVVGLLTIVFLGIAAITYAGVIYRFYIRQRHHHQR